MENEWHEFVGEIKEIKTKLDHDGCKVGKITVNIYPTEDNIMELNKLQVQGQMVLFRLQLVPNQGE